MQKTGLYGLKDMELTLKSEMFLDDRLKRGFKLKLGTSADVSAVTRVIRKSFEVWKRLGMDLGPMHQTDAETTSHLVNKGYVLLTNENEVIGTFSLDEAMIEPNQSGSILYQSNGGSAIPYSAAVSEKMIPFGKYLVFKKAAVLEEFAGRGLGDEFLKITQAYAEQGKYRGIALETVAETQWLYQWYLNRGFNTIASYRYPNRFFDTLLLVRTHER